LLGAGIALALAAPAGALTLDFEEFVHGEIVTSHKGVLITAENFDDTAGHPDIAVAFDSLSPDPTTDPDLLQGAGWTTGNIPSSEELGKLLIIQENDDCTATICSDPDDQAGVGGQITLDYSDLGTFNTFRFDLVDHEGGASESGSVQFLLGGVQVGSVFAFDAFAGVTYGDNSANRIDVLDVVDGIEFDEVVIAIRGSGAIDNIVTMMPIPEPNSMALCGMGLVMLAVVGRRRGVA
jgi:hypothetical protein